MADKGIRGGYHGTTGDLMDSGQHRMVNGYTTKLHEGKQGKHIPQHNNYDKDAGRSIFHGTLADAQKLIDQLAGTGWRPPNSPNKEIVDCGRVIGTYVGGKTGKRIPTTRATIHYSKTGTHIVPSKPKEY